MPDKRLISSFNGLNQYQHIDPMRPGDLIMETQQDCTDILEAVKVMRDRPVGKTWRLVAEVPDVFIAQSVREGWLHDKKKWHKWLNDPDNAGFRVWKGRIGPTHQV